MANRWGNHENSDRLSFLGLQKSLQTMTADVKLNDACSLEEKLWQTVWDITLPTKVCLVKAMVFPVVMYGYDIWTIKKAECWRIDAFELWYWGRLLRVPWTARRSNQLILKEINPEFSLEGLMLKLQYFGQLIWRVNSLEKALMLGKIKGRRRRGQQTMRWLDASLTQWTWVWASSRRWWRTGKSSVLQPMGSQSQTWLSYWTTKWLPYQRAQL